MTQAPFKLFMTRAEAIAAGYGQMTEPYTMPTEWEMMAAAATRLAKAKSIHWSIVESAPGKYEVWRFGMRVMPEDGAGESEQPKEQA